MKQSNISEDGRVYCYIRVPEIPMVSIWANGD